MRKKILKDNDAKISKQLEFYNKNKDIINLKRRQKYRLKSNSFNENKLKSYNIFSVSNKTKLIPINLQNTKNNPILSLFSLVERSYYSVIRKNETNHYIGSKSTFSFYPKYLRVEPLLQEIMLYMVAVKSTSFGYSEFKTIFGKVNKYKLKREVQRLVNLKWILRFGHGDVAFYALNPFLEYLLEMNYSNYIWLLEYASYKIDFFDLLNIPLISFLQSKEHAEKICVTPHKRRIGQIKTIFNYGFVTIKIHTETGNMYQTYLPVNLHGQSIFSGKKERDLFEHFCIPINWELFDIQESRYYSKYDKELNKTVYIHFDNSISILCNAGKFYFGYDQWTNALKKWQGYQYLEFRDFKTLKELFETRFVKGKRRLNLFSEMGLKYKNMKHKKVKKQLKID